MFLFRIWTIPVQTFIPIYQQIWILQIFSHFSLFLAQNFYYFTPKYGDIKIFLQQTKYYCESGTYDTMVKVQWSVISESWKISKSESVSKSKVTMKLHNVQIWFIISNLKDIYPKPECMGFVLFQQIRITGFTLLLTCSSGSIFFGICPWILLSKTLTEF